MKRALLYIGSAILYVGLIFVVPSVATAAISFVSSSTSQATGAATQSTSTINTTSGNLLVVGCRHGTTFVAPTNVTDTIGDTFTQFSFASDSNDGALTGYFTVPTSSNVSNIVGCNFASSVGNRWELVAQYTGINPTNTLD